ncbi:MAG: hypothetical protein LUF28_08220 [Clostridiales bacterium]|nr:hypothetical protein [Clostridiales bacterium]
MNEILKSIYYLAADEVDDLNPLSKFYQRSERADKAYAMLSDQLDKLASSKDENSELNDMLCELSESFAECGFVNGFKYGTKLAQEVKT